MGLRKLAAALLGASMVLACFALVHLHTDDAESELLAAAVAMRKAAHLSRITSPLAVVTRSPGVSPSPRPLQPRPFDNIEFNIYPSAENLTTCESRCDEEALRAELGCHDTMNTRTCFQRFVRGATPTAAGKYITDIPSSLRGCAAGLFCPMNPQPAERLLGVGPHPGFIPPRDDDPPVRVSVVHSFYKDAALYQFFQFPLWERVAADPVLRDAVEFIVVDDASPADASLAALLTASFTNASSPGWPDVRLRLVEVTKRIGMNIAGTRNTGVYLSRADVVVLADSDIQPSFDLLHELVALSVDISTSKASALSHFRMPLWPPLQQSWGEPLPHLWRATPAEIVIHKSLYGELGGWDEDFSGVWGWEDVLFGECAKRYTGPRGSPPKNSTALAFIHEPREPGKSDPRLLRPNGLADGYHPVYPGPNQKVYKAKMETGQFCNRKPVMRLPWRVIAINR